MRKRMLQTLVLLVIFIALLAVYKTTEAIPDCNIYRNWYVYQTPKDYAKKLVIENWGIDQWQYFDKIIESESNWRPQAKNPNSSAVGLPQALSGLHDLPDGYRENAKVQIRWAINYTDTRYGSPQEAWHHWQHHNWW